MDDKWRVIGCPHCGGHGVTWNPESWFGVEECGDCGESGELWIRPKGHLFQYPGGPAAGMWDEHTYEHATPVMPYEWHAWLETNEEVDKFIVDDWTGSFNPENIVHCACGFTGTIHEHDLHVEDEKARFIAERTNGRIIPR